MRILYKFGKKDRLRFVSHLDLQRYMQRAFNRTELPIAFTQGFNPHPVMNFASALAMGWTSECELMDVKLAQDVTREFAIEQLKRALPEGLPVLDARIIDDRHPSCMSLLRYADYTITLTGESAESIIGMIDRYLSADTVMAVRKTKSSEKEINIRPLSVFVKSEQTKVFCRLALTETDTLKPDLLVSTLMEMASAKEAEMRIHRTALIGDNGADLFTL